jgi:hypothetical protein
MNRVGLTSKTYDVDDFAAAQEFYHSNGCADGLPVVPPTATAVEACPEWALMPPDQLIGIEPVRVFILLAEDEEDTDWQPLSIVRGGGENFSAFSMVRQRGRSLHGLSRGCAGSLKTDIEFLRDRFADAFVLDARELRLGQLPGHVLHRSRDDLI